MEAPAVPAGTARRSMIRYRRRFNKLARIGVAGAAGRGYARTRYVRGPTACRRLVAVSPGIPARWPRIVTAHTGSSTSLRVWTWVMDGDRSGCGLKPTLE